VNAVVLDLPGNGDAARDLAERLGSPLGTVQLRPFPDGESAVRIDADVAGRDVALVCTLDRPNGKVVPLALAAGAAREQGARSVGLVAPYLAYMRQDRAFRAGEGTSARHFARLLSAAVDWLVTVDPHLHRIRALDEILPIPVAVAHAAGPIAAWLRVEVPDAVVIGPDVESEQWVAEVARRAGVPAVVLAKRRLGDGHVEMQLPEMGAFRDRTPVLVDDIVSTAGTMIAAVALLRGAGMRAPTCVGIHAILAGGAYRALAAAGAQRIVTCRTIAHPSNAIDVGAPIAGAVAELLARPSDPS